MTTLNATEARSKLYSLIDETSTSHQPIVITGKRGNAVLLSEEDWNAINETLHLLSIAGMRESLLRCAGRAAERDDYLSLPDIHLSNSPIAGSDYPSTGFASSECPADSRTVRAGLLVSDERRQLAAAPLFLRSRVPLYCGVKVGERGAL